MHERISQLMRAGYAGLFIVSYEETRVELEIKRALEDLNSRVRPSEQFNTYTWSVARGVNRHGEKPRIDRETQSPVKALDFFSELGDNAVMIARDFHLFVEEKNPTIWRKLREVIMEGRNTGKFFIILGCRFVLPPELDKEIAIVEFKLPDKQMLRLVLNKLLSLATGATCPDPVAAVNAASGMTTIEAENAFSLSLIETANAGDFIDPKLVYREKCSAIKKDGILEVVPETGITLDSIGGLHNVKRWLLERADAYSEDAIAYGLPPPRGVMAVGQPGTGKSLLAKATAAVMNRPLLKLDASRLFGSLVGQTEGNWRRVHSLAKAMAPCILWIDEVDGAMAGHSAGGSHDGGTTTRVIKSILQDMQEDSEGIFYVMTANDIDNLPAPLLRRVDEIFNVELPTAAERKQIWEIQLRKWKRAPERFDLSMAIAASDGFSGAEIEKIVKGALSRAYANGRREPTSEDLVTLCQEFTPLSVTMKDDIIRRRDRLAGVAKLAGGEESFTPTQVVDTTPALGKRKLIGSLRQKD